MSGSRHASAVRTGATVRIGDLEVVDHRLEVPLDHEAPDGRRIDLFAREVRHAGGGGLPWLVFLQGGPGFEATRPLDAKGWIGAAATQRFRVLLVDQRGTGNSSPVESTHAPDASVLRHLRLDAIVRDCELWRHQLAGEDERWSVLGQSYGGFCAVHYLASRPEALERVLLTGGLPPLVEIDRVYERTFACMRRRSLEHYASFPGDAELVGRIAARLAAGDVRLPGGDVLSVRRFQQVGMALGQSRGSVALHWLFESAFAGAGNEPTQRFLHAVERSQSYPTNPLYAVLHEAIYSEGPATGWSAERVRAASGEHEWRAGEPLTLTAESIHPWMFEEYGALRPFAAAAEELARIDDWSPLYDRARLAANRVPVAAAVYTNDLYVDRQLSLDTAAAIGGCSVYESATHEHDGLREDGPAIFGELLARTRRVPDPSTRA
ncbi:Proline iminopeptidase [Planctomycetes bacterium Pla163]|uniref:Proline iminopeptidase n=1 Tax=Rohdeia mirabilis TaxID=2528008 RepID=A0A518CY47_9BACT|nr:Proline iminopeptidase [Planctomycetes bacterium Pla163]